MNGGYTALSVAAVQRHKHIVKILLDHGANIDAADENNITPLMAAITKAKWDVVEFIIERGGDLTRSDALGGAITDYLFSCDAPESLIQRLRFGGLIKGRPRLAMGSRGCSWPGKVTLTWRSPTPEDRGFDNELAS
jgi:ankyrin repeat protein